MFESELITPTKVNTQKSVRALSDVRARVCVCVCVCDDVLACP